MTDTSRVASGNASGTESAPATLTGDRTLDLPEFVDPPTQPMQLLKGWLVRAQADGVSEPLAASLATAGPVDGDGPVLPSTRTIAVKAFDERGLVFGTFTSSRKGRDLTANPYAALVFYWRETMQQLRIEGPVERLGDAESVALFEDRPREAQATTTVSHQGEPLTGGAGGEDALAERARQLAAGDARIPKPDDWAGYRLVPTSIEFWHGRTSRLHRRLAYRRATPADAWTHTRLQP